MADPKMCDCAAISLRDYFAAAALQGMMDLGRLQEPKDIPALSILAYAVADAMLEQRGKNK